MSQTTADIVYLENKDEEIFFPVTHVDGVLDDDGTPLSVTLGQIGASVMESHTWSELISMRNNGELVPGKYYRMTDYVTTVHPNYSGVTTTNVPFDLILLALSTDQFSEHASAAIHEGNTYFVQDANGVNIRAKLSAWKIWYCIDNDRDRFDWANNTSTPGKGVIYRMIDEWNNDCPYDFKSILFAVNACGAAGESRFIYSTGLIIDSYYFTFSCFHYDTGTPYDASLTNYAFDPYGVRAQVYNNTIGPAYFELTGASNNVVSTKRVLPFNVFAGSNVGTNVNGTVSSAFIGFHDIKLGSNCTGNAFANGTCNITLGDNCEYNAFYKFSGNIKLQNSCSFNIIDPGTINVSFGFGCNNNFITNSSVGYSHDITFGNNCTQNELANIVSASISNGCFYLDLSNISCLTVGNGCGPLRYYGYGTSAVSIGDYCAYLSLSAGNTGGGSSFTIAPGTRASSNDWYGITLVESYNPRILHRAGSAHDFAIDDY